jgi:hypothetical protein
VRQDCYRGPPIDNLQQTTRISLLESDFGETKGLDRTAMLASSMVRLSFA